MNTPPDAHAQQIIRSWNANPEAARLGQGEFHVQDYGGIANRQWRGGPFAAAPASVIFICKAGIREQTARMEPHQ